MGNKKDVKLYNVLFPFWMLLMLPQLWLAVLPGNFLIDSLVLIVCMKIFRIEDKKKWYKQHILKVFCFGMLSDFIGSAFMILLLWGFQLGTMGDELYITIPALIIAAICIFVFNYFVTFRKLDKKLRFSLALIFAVVTAPYTFLVPSSWLYY